MSEQRIFARLKNFYQGFAPLAHISSLTEKGAEGSASEMLNVDVLGEVLQQGPALANLVNGTETGAINELINHILEVPPLTDTTFGISTTKLHRITPNEVINASPFPQTITNCVKGHSVAYLRGGLYYFFNRANDGAIGTYNLNVTFNHAWQTGLQKANLMPVGTKEDIMLFGHGRYVGVYFHNTSSMNLTRLDFGENHEVADIVFHGNQWLIAVNGGIGGSNRNYAQIFTYEGGATTAMLSDEASVGLQRIGFLFPLGGVVYVAYQDLSFEGGYMIGYLAGRKIEPLVYFKGSLPNYTQKTLFRNTILFVSGGLVYSAGAIVGDLPFALSQLASGGYGTVGALSAPFGVPMVASTNGTNYRLAKFSGLTTSSNWKSVVIPTLSGKLTGYLDYAVVRTNSLETGARADIKMEINGATETTDAYQITGVGKMKHIFNINKSNVDDFRVVVDFSNGHATNPCQIKEILIVGHHK